jgi:hypothetical protein
MMSEYAGPMGLANQEIRDAIDRFTAERLGNRRLPALLERTDTMLTELETLNLMEVRRTPAPLRSALTALIADLPFEYSPPIGPRPKPTAAIDVVFEIQAGIFNLMYGTEPADQMTEPADRLIEVAS